jgi:hypothetical protein
MKRTWSDRHTESGRNQLRNKAKKPKPQAEDCTCPASGLSTTCPIRLHRERAKIVQGFGIDPTTNLPNKQYVLEHPESPK